MFKLSKGTINNEIPPINPQSIIEEAPATIQTQQQTIEKIPFEVLIATGYNYDYEIPKDLSCIKEPLDDKSFSFLNYYFDKFDKQHEVLYFMIFCSMLTEEIPDCDDYYVNAYKIYSEFIDMYNLKKTEKDYEKALKDLEYFRDEMLKSNYRHEPDDYEMDDIRDCVNTIVTHITDGNNIEKEVTSVMGGKIYELHSERIIREATEPLKKEIEEKNHQLADKDNQLADKDNQISELKAEIEKLKVQNKRRD